MMHRWPGIWMLVLLLSAAAEAQTLEFSSEAYNAGEGQGSVTLTVVKSGTATGPISVHYATKNDGPGAPFATVGTDYVATEGDLTFAPNETTKTLSIAINQDAVHESSEIFYVVLSNPMGGAAVRAPSSAQVTILDDDAGPTVQFGSANYSVNESGGFVTLTVTKTGATETPVRAYYKTRDGTAKAPSDYTFTGDDLTASVVFEPAATSQEIQIPVNDDGYREPDETFEVYFTVVLEGTPGSPGTATITIVDDDPRGPEPPAKALNIATRAHVLTGDRVLIPGFIITGNDSKRVILRALGPSLIGNGVPSNAALLDPVLQLNRADGTVVATNDNWKDDPANVAQLTGTPFAPKDDREAVIIVTLPPGSYTAFVTGKGQQGGIALAEVYDVTANAEAELANISTRGYVGQENDVMIGGFILGNEPGSVRIAVRGIGPSLATYGLSNVLPDPTLALYNTNGAGIASNDDWQSDPLSAAQLTAHGLALSHPKEAGLFVTLAPGQYTAILNGKFVGTGIGLVEIYNLR